MSYQKIGIHKQYRQEADAVISQANPVSATAYTVLATTPNVRITSIAVWVTWTVQPTVSVDVAIDGETRTFTYATPVSGTKYYAAIAPESAANAQGLNTSPTVGGVLLLPLYLEGRSVAVTAYRTGGTAQALDCRVKYARREF